VTNTTSTRNTAGVCCFCDRPFAVVGRSSEHVIPQWLLNYLGILRTHKHIGLTTDADGELLNKVTASAFSRTYGRVCEKCNNGWMSSLETATQRVFLRIFRRRIVEISPVEARLLVGWAYKTFALMHLTDRGERKSVIRKSDLKSLCENGLPQGESELSLSRAAILTETRLKVFMPRVRYYAMKEVTLEPLVAQSDNFIGLLQFEELLLTYVYKAPPLLWMTNVDSRLEGEMRIWPMDEPLRIETSELPLVTNPSEIKIFFTANVEPMA